MKPKSLILGALAVAALHLGDAPPARAGTLRWTMLEIGTGDANYIRLPNGKDLIIDGGKPDDGEDFVVPFLNSLDGFDGVVDYLVATHADTDHYGGLEDVLNSFTVAKVYSPTFAESTAPSDYFYAHFAVPVASEGCPWIVKGGADAEASGGVSPGAFDIGCSLSWDPEVSITCLSVGNSGTTNNDSIVLSLRCGGSSFLFTGDLSSDPMVNAVLNNYGGLVPSDIHKVIHHGSVSDGANSVAWINRVHSVHPGYAFISCIGSAFHPTTQCLDRLLANSTSIYMTFLDGNITVRADSAGNYSIARERTWNGILLDPHPTERAAYPPALPAGLRVAGRSANAALLDWDDVTADSEGTPLPAGTVAYDVFRSTLSGGDPSGGTDLLPGMSDPCGIYEKITLSPVANSAYADTAAAPGRTYYYRVSAVRTDYGYERRYSNEAAAAAGAGAVVSGDYDGDGTDEVALFRGGGGLWGIRNLTRIYFGGPGDQPVSADYDGDGTTECAVFRGYYGLWSVRERSRFYFGGSGGLPAPADYDGDRRADPAWFRPSSGLWAVRGLTRRFLGTEGDRAVPGDYNGDGTAETAVFRASYGLWAAGDRTRFFFGSPDDAPVPGDFSGASSWEAAVFRPASSLWSVRGLTRIYLGSADDCPVPADYDGDGTDDAAIFRDADGTWSARSVTRACFGGAGDVPATR